MNEINEIKEPLTQITETPTKEELIKRFADIQQITLEEANKQVGADTIDEVLKKIEDTTLEKIRASQPPMNRAQRRALKKKMGAKKYAEMVANGDEISAVTETAKKLNYIDLIQKLRKLNEEKEKNGENVDQDD